MDRCTGCEIPDELRKRASDSASTAKSDRAAALVRYCRRSRTSRRVSYSDVPKREGNAMQKTTSQKALKVISIIMIVFAALTLLLGCLLYTS